MKVLKFGGSSVAGSEQFKKVKKIIETDESRKVVIVSASGKRNDDDHKMTDLLYLCYAHLQYGVACDDIVNTLANRFEKMAKDLNLQHGVESEFRKYASGISKSTSQDEIVSRGEYFTARLMAEYLGFHFLDAKECIYFNLEGDLDKEKTYSALAEAYEKYDKIVIPGFYGVLPTGKIKVMSRGGSDVTGAIVSAALDAEVYENWTDVSGILMADPRIVDAPKPIPQITFGELRELSYMGASVLHEESILPVKEKKIPINIRNTNEPEHHGTIIVERIERQNQDDIRPITGISGRKDFIIITVAKHNMDTTSSLRLALEIFDNYKVHVEQITLGMESFALVVSQKAVESIIYNIIADLKKACRTEDISIDENIALVAAVGHKMTSKPGTSGKIFKALGENGVNIRTIAQGAEELSIIVGVDNENFETAIRVLYDGFAG